MNGWNDLPLKDIRVLAVEQMQSVPFGTQLLARLGADVVKVEHPLRGDSGRQGSPSLIDKDGRRVGATYLRNNLGKRSIGIDLGSPEGVDLVKRLVPKFDVFVENAKPGSLDKLGLGYEQMKRLHPRLVYASVSGFGSLRSSPYRDWPAYAPVVEAMSGLYEATRVDDAPPTLAPAGPIADTSAALFLVAGILAAVHRRDILGEGGQIEVALFDAMLAMTDIIPNYWSLGAAGWANAAGVVSSFRARDGYFVVQAIREHQLERFAHVIGHPEWLEDERFADRDGWAQQLEAMVRPAVEEWARGRSKGEAAAELAAAGVAAGPSNSIEDLLSDPHLASHAMVVSVERPGGGPPVLVGGNPIKLGGTADRADQRWPRLGEHTYELLREELGMTMGEVEELRSSGAVG